MTSLGLVWQSLTDPESVKLYPHTECMLFLYIRLLAFLVCMIYKLKFNIELDYHSKHKCNFYELNYTFTGGLGGWLAGWVNGPVD